VRTSIWRNNLMGLLVAGLMAAVGCGPGQEERQTQSIGEQGEDAPAAAMSHESAGDAEQATDAEPAAQPEPAHTDQSAEGAVRLWIDRLVQGDFAGAADVCKADSAGAKALRDQAEGFERARNDPSAGAETIAMAVSLMTEGFTQASVTEIESGPDRAVFEVRVPNKDPQEIEVVLVDDAWRVIPPASGLPSG